MTTNKKITYMVDVYDLDKNKSNITLTTDDINWYMDQYCRNRNVSRWEIKEINFNCNEKSKS